MKNALEIRGLTRKYEGFALDSVNLTLPRGCVMGLIGENDAHQDRSRPCAAGQR